MTQHKKTAMICRHPRLVFGVFCLSLCLCLFVVGLLFLFGGESFFFPRLFSFPFPLPFPFGGFGIFMPMEARASRNLGQFLTGCCFRISSIVLGSVALGPAPLPDFLPCPLIFRPASAIVMHVDRRCCNREGCNAAQREAGINADEPTSQAGRPGALV